MDVELGAILFPRLYNAYRACMLGTRVSELISIATASTRDGVENRRQHDSMRRSGAYNAQTRRPSADNSSHRVAGRRRHAARQPHQTLSVVGWLTARCASTAVIFIGVHTLIPKHTR